ncbi:MAG: D-alanine--D-alanine ligase [bacterium]|nr:D-alanine--D-alanine ligase [bacterium]
MMLRDELLDRTAEYDSPQTINTLRDAIATQGHDVVLIEADDEAYERLHKGGIDFVFNIAEGIRGEDREAQIPAILEMLGIPYTGSRPLTLALCLHKAKTKEILSYYDIPTPAFQVMSGPHETLANTLSYPLIVKLLHEGSSMGLSYASVVETPQALAERVGFLTERYAQAVIVEQFIDGREFTVPVLGNTPPCPLPVIEVLFRGPRNITLFQPDDAVILMIARERGKRLSEPPQYRFSSNQEYSLIQTEDGEELAIPISLTTSVCPARISSDLTAALQNTAQQAYLALECRDWGRIDMRVGDDGVPQVLELNPIAGIDPTYWLPRSALAAGMAYTTLIRTILDAACQRYGI